MRLRLGAVVIGLVGCAWTPGVARAAPAPSLTLHVSALRVRSHRPVTLTGVLTGAPSGTPVTLLEYPYDRPETVLAQVIPDAGGAFVLAARPNRITWFRATATVAGAAVSSRMLRVDVRERTDTRVSHLSLGRAQVTVLVYHPADLRWNGILARWRFTAGGRTISAQAATKRLSRYVAQLHIVVALPAGRFGWRVCSTPPTTRRCSIRTARRDAEGAGTPAGARCPTAFRSRVRW